MALFHFYLPSLVPELDGLGYFTKYPSPPSSGTIVGHQVPHGLWPTKLLIFFFYLYSVFFETHVLDVKTCEVLELGGLGYFTKYPSPSSSSTKLGKLG